VPLKSEDKRWDSTFARFVSDYGVDHLAEQLDVTSPAIYQWIAGNTGPKTSNALAIQDLAKRCGIKLSLEEIYQQSQRKAQTR
jgi:hypothetical protein